MTRPAVDRVRLDALRAILATEPPRDAATESALRARCAGHDDLAWAFGVASLTGWRVVCLPETCDPGLPFAALGPDGSAWLPWRTVALEPGEAAALAAAEDPPATFEYVDGRLGGAARGRHAVAEAAVDALRLHGEVLWPHVVSVPDGVEGKAEEAVGVDDRHGEGAPAWLAQAMESHRGDGVDDACVALIQRLSGLLETGAGQAEVRRALDASDLQAMPDLLAVTLSRMTSSHKDVLGEAWYGFRDRMRDAWTARGKDPVRSMRGLLDDRSAPSRKRNAGHVDWTSMTTRVTHLAPLDDDTPGMRP